MIRTLAIATAAALAGSAAAQSATYSFSASATTVAPGDTVTLTFAVDANTGGAGSGVFGPAGFYGFGGNFTVSGDLAADVTAASGTILANLPSGDTSTLNTGSAAARAAAGRGLDDALSVAAPIDVYELQLTVDAGAANGTFTVDYDGAAVLVQNNSLVTYATSPGTNQSSIAGSSIEITVGSGGCSPADLAEPFGIVDIDDVDAFITAFLSGDAAADLVAPFGIVDIDDVDNFITLFLAGCP